MPEETKTPPKLEAPKASAPDAAMAKVGEHVTYFDTDKLIRRQAIICSITGSVASLKVMIPRVRNKGGGVAKVDNVKFTDKPAKGCWGL